MNEGDPVTVPPHDASPRSGSATSLVLSIVGLYLRRVGSWISTANLVALAEEAGVSAPLARTAIARLKKRGILVPESSGKSAGYRLPPSAEDILRRGDRRIFSVHKMEPSDPWCLISFSIPESQRSVRGQLRRRLLWIGAGLISSALWICPDFLRSEVEDILTDLDVRSHAVLFTTSQPIVAGRIEDAIAQWWDLERIASLHEEFAEMARQLLAAPAPDARTAFRDYVRGIDSWRVIPYLDPGLAFEILPPTWPGRETERLFEDLSEHLSSQAWDFVCETVGATTHTATGSTLTALKAS